MDSGFLRIGKQIYNNVKQFKQHLNESSLSRIWKHNEEHDAGALTAFRKGPGCGDTGKLYTRKENAQRNKSLLAKLKTKGYGVTKLHGTYPEGGKVSKEVSYFVVDLKDTGKLEKDMRKLGQEFDQDSILFVPKGAIKGDAKAYLVGTNRCETNWLGFGKKTSFHRGRMGYDSPIYTSKVNGRPFIFESIGETVESPQTGFGHWAMHLVAERDWQEIEI